jgi:hypothetical protein
MRPLPDVHPLVVAGGLTTSTHETVDRFGERRERPGLGSARDVGDVEILRGLSVTRSTGIRCVHRSPGAGGQPSRRHQDRAPGTPVFGWICCDRGFRSTFGRERCGRRCIRERAATVSDELAGGRMIGRMPAGSEVSRDLGSAGGAPVHPLVPVWLGGCGSRRSTGEASASRGGTTDSEARGLSVGARSASSARRGGHTGWSRARAKTLRGLRARRRDTGPRRPAVAYFATVRVADQVTTGVRA